MNEEHYGFNFNEGICQPADDEIVRVVYTHPNREGRLYDYCQAHGIVCYLPLKRVWKPMAQSHGGKVYQYPKEVLRPMFPNYMFVRMAAEQRTLLFSSNAVIRILRDTEQNQTRLLNEIHIVHQIETIAMTEEVSFNAEVQEGSRFLVESGPWQGIYGWLKKKKKTFVWQVELECVNTIVQATIDPSKCKMTPA